MSGVFGSMNVVLKNNAMLQRDRVTYKEIVERYSESKPRKAVYAEGCKHVIRRIRDKVIVERRQRERKILIVWIIMFTILSSSFLYVLTH